MPSVGLTISGWGLFSYLYECMLHGTGLMDVPMSIRLISPSRGISLMGRDLCILDFLDCAQCSVLAFTETFFLILIIYCLLLSRKPNARAVQGLSIGPFFGSKCAGQLSFFGFGSVGLAYAMTIGNVAKIAIFLFLGHFRKAAGKCIGGPRKRKLGTNFFFLVPYYAALDVIAGHSRILPVLVFAHPLLPVFRFFGMKGGDYDAA